MFFSSFSFGDSVNLELSGFDIFLGVVPGSSGVGLGGGHDESACEGSGKESGNSNGSKEESEHEGGEQHDGSGSNHVFEGGFGGDGDAGVVIGDGFSGSNSGVDSELSSDFLNHLTCGEADSLKAPCGECVGEHGSDDQGGQNNGVGEVDDSDLMFVCDVGGTVKEGSV